MKFLPVVMLMFTLLPLQAAAESPKSKSDSVGPEVDRVVPARSVVGVELSGSFSGSVSDLIVDLDAGHLALLVVEVEDAPSDSVRLLPPSSVAWNAGASTVSLETTTQAASASVERSTIGHIDRRQVAARYQESNLKLYWPSEDSFGAAHRGLSREGFVLASELWGRKIVDRQGQSIGELNDFAIVPGSGEVVYATLRLSEHSHDDPLHVLPLPAVVVPEKTGRTWMIELDRDQLPSMQSFSAASWPTKIDRGWTEYIHVRYGKSPLNGIQRNPAVD